VDTFFDLLVTSDLPRPQTIPALDVLPAQRMSPHSEISEQRAIGLWRLASRKTSITITPVASALLRTEAAEFYRQLALTLRVGEEIPLEDLLAHLESIGYEKRDPVEMVGEYSLRGGILDIFPAEASKPIRIELFGDLIESIRRFDVETQRSVMKDLRDHAAAAGRISQIARAVSGDRRSDGWASPGDPFPGWEFWCRWCARNRIRCFRSPKIPWSSWMSRSKPRPPPSACGSAWKKIPIAHFPARRKRISTPGPSCATALEGNAELALRELEVFHRPNQQPATSHDGRTTSGRRWPSTATSRPPSPKRAIWWSKAIAWSSSRDPAANWSGWPIFSRSIQFPSNWASIPPTPRALISPSVPMSQARRQHLPGQRTGPPRRRFPAARIAVFGSEDLFDSSDLVAKPGPSKSQLAAFTADMADLKPGDYVVHEAHGIGRFLGTREIAQGDNKGDFMLLEYAGDAKLYVPLARLDLIQKYRGAGEGAAPPLDRLGGVTWERTKSRVKAKMRDMADELLKLYAQRRMAEGFRLFARQQLAARVRRRLRIHRDQRPAFAPSSRSRKTWRARIPWIACCAATWATARPRSPCARRSKGWATASKPRCWRPPPCSPSSTSKPSSGASRPFPVRIEMLSRFRDKKEIAEVLEGLAEGKVDIVIGTHRIAFEGREFRDLGPAGGG
jgi:transcription-repair coupling factor (superfamily II helicase)